MKTTRSPLAPVLLTLLAACGGPPPLDEIDRLIELEGADHEHETYDDFVVGLGGAQQEQGLAVPGRWQLPADLVPISQAQDVAYHGAPPYNGGANCAGGSTAGARTLRDHLLGYFPQISGIGIYNCRVIAGTNSMSLHGVGRALDIMIPMSNGSADNDAGDPIAHYLIEHAEEMGIQMIIWDQSIWRSNRNPRQYALASGNPHIDHLHVELNQEGAAQQTPWFDAPAGPAPCGTMPASGGVIDNGHACLSLYGPAQYWRAVSASGHAGALAWTNAYANNRASNWAKWSLPLSAAGRYRVEVFIDDTYGLFERTRYEVRAGSATYPVILNQAAASGWALLGEFDFVASGAEHVTVYDNAPAPVGQNLHIAVDALRISPVSGGAPPPGAGAAEGCAPLAAVGGVIDESGPCFELFGPAQFWRAVSGAGHEGSLLWTNAFQSNSPSNWAFWRLPVSASGEYQLSVYLDPAHAQFAATRYEVAAGASRQVLTVNQASADGWKNLGVFSLEAGADNALWVYDHAADAVGAARRIAVDAVQLVRVSSAPQGGRSDDEVMVADEGAEHDPTDRAPLAPELACKGLHCGAAAIADEGPVFDEGTEGLDDDELEEADSAQPSVEAVGCAQSRGSAFAFGWLGLVLLVSGPRRRRARC